MQEKRHMGWDTKEECSYISKDGKPVIVKIVQASNGNEVFKLLVINPDQPDAHINEWFENSYEDLAAARNAQRAHVEKYQKKNG